MADLKPAEFLRFEELPNEGMRTRRFTVRSSRHHDVLGGIRWFVRWRQYVFEPTPGTVFNNTCLIDIADRVSYLNTMHRILNIMYRNGGEEARANDRDASNLQRGASDADPA